MMSAEVVGDLWWKNAVIYCLDVETFYDSDGDGIGDFKWLTERLDYLAGLSVNCAWLMPFYPSDQRDDGNDVTDAVGEVEARHRLATHPRRHLTPHQAAGHRDRCSIAR